MADTAMEKPVASGANTIDLAGVRSVHHFKQKRSLKWLVPTIYIVLLMLPIYWLLNMSLKTNQEILSSFTLLPNAPTLDNYRVIFSDPSWYTGYINSIIYVALNTIISISVALPAAYAFSRYRFLGDKHMFFWLLSNRMAPAAVFVLPFFQL
ncbi:MAG: carbohydrate ABC transporter permease, partial [Pseudomonadota bacterium]